MGSGFLQPSGGGVVKSTEHRSNLQINWKNLKIIQSYRYNALCQPQGNRINNYNWQRKVDKKYVVIQKNIICCSSFLRRQHGITRLQS